MQTDPAANTATADDDSNINIHEENSIALDDIEEAVDQVVEDGDLDDMLMDQSADVISIADGSSENTFFFLGHVWGLFFFKSFQFLSFPRVF